MKQDKAVEGKKIKNSPKRCCLCREERDSLNNIHKHHVRKGRTIYLCVDCHRWIHSSKHESHLKDRIKAYQKENEELKELLKEPKKMKETTMYHNLNSEFLVKSKGFISIRTLYVGSNLDGKRVKLKVEIQKTKEVKK